MVNLSNIDPQELIELPSMVLLQPWFDLLHHSQFHQFILGYNRALLFQLLQ
jgi:hypothetical protein